ncbi:multicopper oxidase family protein [Microbispora sp. NBC_01189]|uniref:multicopper oxidase family protein n=1 Tax=Microbispora sp. NBC_01189 TaxID=2903583 RepID=UPI002E14F194|nr:multicopper oxidase family protein [Microbispora sp. NBC_01189]
MTTARLIALDQILFVLVAAAWAATAGFALTGLRQPAAAGRRTRLIAAASCAAAIVVTALRVAVTAGLAGAGWWFVAEKVTLALPLVVVPALVSAAVSLPRLLRGTATGSPSDFPAGIPADIPAGIPAGSARIVAFPLLVTAYGAVAGIACAVVISYPVTAGGAAAVLALFAVASAATWRLLGPARSPRHAWQAAGTCVLALALALTIGGGWPSGHLHSEHDAGGHDAGGRGVSVDLLRGPAPAAAGGPAGARERIRRFTLTAQPATVRLPSGGAAEAWSFNGQVPGPVLRVRQGDLVEVVLRNRLPVRESAEQAGTGQGVTIHWHGYDVPAAEDGVPGVTQDAVWPGQTHVYRFRAEDAGTYWYHSHQNSSVAVPRGLFGLLVVDPATPVPESEDHVLALHTFGSRPTLSVDGAAPSDLLTHLPLPPGARTRLRVVNTDTQPVVLGLSGAPYRIAAVDGGDVPGATDLDGARLHLAAGGRYDLTFTVPSGPVLLTAGNRPALLVNGPATPPPAAGPVVDITRYGTPAALPARFDRFDRETTWVLDKTLAVSGGLPRLAQTVNGKAWPNIPTPVVRQGETVRIRVVNRGTDTHPMHPHGHHVRILSRNGVPATGLPMDTFDVAPGEVWEVALVADNPGVWMSHCHDLAHAAQGMEFHLAYEGVTTPYDMTNGNHPA